MIHPPRQFREAGLFRLSTAVFALSISAYATPASGAGGPHSASASLPVSALATVDVLEMEPVDVEALRTADARRENAFVPGPRRFAAPIDIDLSLYDRGTRDLLEDGSSLWRLRIRSAGALALNFGFRRFDLPIGASLWLYDPARTVAQGPYTAVDRSRSGELWTALVPGEEAVLEIHLPAGAGEPALILGRVGHAYRDVGLEPRQGDCNIDVACPEVDPFRDQARAVARYTLEAIFSCTGTLLHNTAADFRPLFLTADHCGINPANDSSVVVYWNFEAPVCGQLSGGSLGDNQSGATLLASDFETDFALLELNQRPDPDSNVYYAGWDASGTVPQSVVGIHHPGGDEKAAAFEGDPLLSLDVGGGFESHWQVTAWDLGTTERGSSGSCIFDQTTKACVGTLTGGFASCEDPEGFDVYGKLSEAWVGDGTDDSRLRNWLDPVGGGTTTFLEGAEAEDGGDGEEGCHNDPTVLCLRDHFAVTSQWSTGSRSGTASPIPSPADEWGALWFFSAENAEVLVKVLDGCELNDHFWVFAAAATDLEYTLTVTDVTTGDARTYANELGRPARAVLDTQAFATCP